MTPQDPDFPAPEDAALDAALRRRFPIPPAILSSLHADRESLMSEAASPAPNIIPIHTAAASRSKLRPLLSLAAVIAVAAFAASLFWPQPSTAIAGISPKGDIASVRPEITWENDSDKSYNVWILPAEGDYTTAPALFVAKGVRSPVSFDALEPGKGAPPGMSALSPGTDYRVLICFSDAGKDPITERVAGTPVSFRVAPSPQR